MLSREDAALFSEGSGGRSRTLEQGQQPRGRLNRLKPARARIRKRVRGGKKGTWKFSRGRNLDRSQIHQNIVKLHPVQSPRLFIRLRGTPRAWTGRQGTSDTPRIAERTESQQIKNL